MDVLCERCNTRYEFDESLVSARGTTVKCTQCGLLFKVFPSDGVTSVQSWTVQRLNGERFVYQKMRELQAAITRGRVAPDDVLIPSVGRPKRLGDIEELVSFFPTVAAPDAAGAPRGSRAGGTRIGLAPPTEGKVTTVEPAVARDRDREGEPLPARTGHTLPPPPAQPVAPTETPEERLARLGRGLAADDPDGPTLQVGLRALGTPPPVPSSSVGEAVAAMEHAMARALSPDDRASAPEARISHSSRETRVRDEREAPTRFEALDRETRVRDEPDEPTRRMPAEEVVAARGGPEEPTAPVAVDRETRVRDEPDEPTRRMPPERDTRVRDDGHEGVPVVARALHKAVAPPVRRHKDTSPELVVSPTGRPPTALREVDGDDVEAARPTLPYNDTAPDFEEGELYITQDDGPAGDGSDPHAGRHRRHHAGGKDLSFSTPPEPDSDHGESIPPLTPSPSIARPSILGRPAAYSGPRFSSFGPGGRRPTFARWAVGLIVLGLLGVGGYTALRRYLPATDPSASARPQDARVDKLLRAGRERLVAGDLEGAREQFVMASGVDDQDPRVLESLADVEIVRADQAWLHLRLLESGSPDRAAVQAELERALKRSDDAAERLGAAAPRDRGAVRARLAVLRLRGDLDGARSLVDQLPNPGPEDAMVLATLDLGAAEPSWTTVLDRLQTAARAEQRLGRAAAYLVYAAARAGRRERALEQLDLLGSYSPPHPLVEPLRRWLDALPAEGAGGADAGRIARADSGGSAGGDGEAVPADFRQALKKAREALRDGKLDRAETLYRAALDQNPGNNEALAGLAEVARARGNTSAAITAYEALLKQNPGYVPGLAALADLKWQTGAKGEARALYRQVIDAAPGSSYADHARARLGSGEPSSEPKSPPPATTSEPPPPPPPPATATTTGAETHDLPPGVDVSDLPDLH